MMVDKIRMAFAFFGFAWILVSVVERLVDKREGWEHGAGMYVAYAAFWVFCMGMAIWEITTW